MLAERIALPPDGAAGPRRRRRRSSAARSRRGRGRELPGRAPRRSANRPRRPPSSMPLSTRPTYLGSAAQLVDRALAFYESSRSRARSMRDAAPSARRAGGRARRCCSRNSLGTTLEMWDPQVAALCDALPARPLRPARPRPLAGPAGPVLDRGPRRATPLEPPGRARPRARLVLRPLDRRDGRHVARVGGAGADRPPRPLLHRAGPAAARAVAGARGDGASRGSRRDRRRRRSPAGSRRSRRARSWSTFRAMLVETPAEGYAGCCEALAELDLRDRLAAIEAPDARAHRRRAIPVAPPEAGERARGGDRRRAPRDDRRSRATSPTPSSRRSSRSTCSPT